MDHQRCIWHGERDLGYMLWKDGLGKKAGDRLVEDFRKVISIDTEDRKEMSK